MERNAFGDSGSPKTTGINALPDLSAVSQHQPWAAPGTSQGFPFLGISTPLPFPHLPLSDPFANPYPQTCNGTSLVPAKQQQQMLYKPPQLATNPLPFKPQGGDDNGEAGILQVPRLTIPPPIDPFHLTSFSRVNSGALAPNPEQVQLQPEEQPESILMHQKAAGRELPLLTRLDFETGEELAGALSKVCQRGPGDAGGFPYSGQSES